MIYINEPDNRTVGQKLDNYKEEIKEVLDGMNYTRIRQAIRDLGKLDRTGKIIFTCGNGGSATTASHLVCDLSKNVSKMFNAICLNDNMALVTAYANDCSFLDIFTEQMDRFNRSLYGALIAVSTSGRSGNVISVANFAKQVNKEILIIALTGGEGGELGKLADIEIRVPSDRIQIIEDVHLSICHMIAVGLGA